MKRKQNGKIFGIVVSILTAMCVYLYYETIHDKPAPPRIRISVIVNDSIDNKWGRLQAGIEQAAKEFDVNISYITMHQFESFEQQQKTIEDEINNGVDGLIVQFVDNDQAGPLMNRIANQTSVCLIETDVNHGPLLEGNYGTVLRDTKGIGKTLAQHAMQEVDGKKPKKIGLVHEPLLDLAKEEIRNTFVEEVEALGGEIGWELEDSSSTTIDIHEKSVPCDVYVGLDDKSLQDIVIYFAMKGLVGEQIYGIGHSDRNLKFMEYGFINDMVINNDAKGGYLAVREIVDHVKNPKKPMGHDVIDYIVVNQENMFELRNDVILFPKGQ